MDSISEDSLLLARAEDAVRLCDKHGYPHFVGFLDERQQSLLRSHLKRQQGISVCFWGGHEQAERTLLGVFPDFLPIDNEMFPLVALTCRYRDQAVLSHRDFLGTLMAHGIRRDKVGDILCFTGKTVVFVSEDIASYLCEQITKVGGEGVAITCGLDEPLHFARTYREVHMTIASLRLDNVVKALTGLSREKAASLITSGLVAHNHLPCQNVSKAVAEGDVLSVRGYGRFRVISAATRTKKDRIVLIAHQYQ